MSPRVLLRSVLLGALAGALVGLAPLLTRPLVFVPQTLTKGPIEVGWPWPWAALELFLLGFVAAPLDLLAEHVRGLRFLVAAPSVAVAWFVAATFEFCYVQVVLWEGSLGKAMKAHGALAFFAQETSDVHPIFLAIALPFIAATLARLRGHPVLAQSFGGALAAAFPLAIAPFVDWDATLVRYALFMATLGFALPPLRAVAERVLRLALASRGLAQDERVL